MRLAIPNPPRKVSLTQVPGAVRRLAMVALGGVALMAAFGFGSRAAGRYVSAERAFLARADEVPGRVSAVARPDSSKGQSEARLTVLYAYAGKERVATGVRVSAEASLLLGPGGAVSLLVDPQNPDAPREARDAREAAGPLGWVWPAVALGALLAVTGVFFEARRTAVADLAPLRKGLLVWLTPDQPLPETRNEIVFPASYYRDDVRYEVRARVRPGRAPVRNGDKVMAAVVPARPRWVRVIDEDLARTLGWFE